VPIVTPIETCPDAEAERAEAVRMVPRTHLTFIVLLTFCSGLRRRPVCHRNVLRSTGHREKTAGKQPKLSIHDVSRRRFHVCKVFSCKWPTKPDHYQ